MMSFRGGRLRDCALPVSSVWLLSDIAEAKGRQHLYTRQAPQLLKVLRETALIQSTESSNRIEGVTVAPDRLRTLVLGNTRPRDRSEEEIQGYRRALNLVHTRADGLPITPETLKKLHKIIQEGGGDAGEWKRINNEITEVLPGQAPVVRFRPVEADGTLAAIQELCGSYQRAVDQEKVPAFLAIASLVLDFLCVHPFRDGNGRVSRLLALLALYHHGVEVGRYIGLERLVEETREDYYEVLRVSSVGWHEGKHDIVPWLNYFLSIVRRAYMEFEKRAGQVRSPRGSKTTFVESAIQDLVGEFTLAQLEQTCPGVSRDMVRRILRDRKRMGKVVCLGRGPGAKWRKKG